MLNQIEDLKKQNKKIESEKENLRLDIGRLNENYVKLTNKYVDLTDLLAAQNLPKQSNLVSTNTNLPKNSLPNYFSTAQPVSQNDSGADSNFDEINLKLQDMLIQYKISSTLFTKIDKGIYLFNNKKVNIKILNGKILVRIGGGSTSLLDFLKNNKIIDKSLNVSTINQSPQDMDIEERIINELKPTPEVFEDENLLATFSLKVKTREVTPKNKNINRYYLKDYEKVGDKTERDEGLSKSMISDSSILKISKDKENRIKKLLINSKSIDKKPSQANSSTNLVTSHILKSRNFRDVSPILGKKSYM